MKFDQPSYPHREICGLCHRESPVGFWVPNDVWAAAVHVSRLHDIHCLGCFIERADAKLVEWADDIKFYPISLRSHLSGIFTVPPDGESGNTGFRVRITASELEHIVSTAQTLAKREGKTFVLDHGRIEIVPDGESGEAEFDPDENDEHFVRENGPLGGRR